jgi:hypothetical protein
MKKVRITVKKGAKGKKFQIFNSPESLYVWMNDPELQSSDRLDPSLGVTIQLKQGETMEVEWLGCEFISEEFFSTRADHIRLGKHIKITPSPVKEIVGIHEGWVYEEIISFKSSSDGCTKTLRLTPKSKHKFDLEELFLSSEEQQDHEIDYENLN